MEKETNGRHTYQYAVKFICTSHNPGTSQSPDWVLPGIYKTIVNIHNPHEKTVKLRKKLAHPTQITKFKSSEIKPDGVEQFICRNISDFEITLIHGFEGFLIIESRESLDVTAVYMAGGKDGYVTSMDVEQVKERKI